MILKIEVQVQFLIFDKIIEVELIVEFNSFLCCTSYVLQ